MNASLRVEDRRVLLRSTEAKSDAANGMDQRIFLTAVNLPTNSADIDVDHVGRRIQVQIPYVLQQHGSRDHLTGVARQICQQSKLARQQFDFPTTAPRDPREQIDLEITDAQYRLLDHRSAAPGERIDPRQHFAECERLDQVIVAAGTQASHAIVDFTQSAEDQRRRDDPFFPQPANDLDPIDARQHAVHRHRDIIDGQSPAQPVFAVDREIDVVAARFQAIHQLFGRLRVVLDHKYVTRIAWHRLRTPHIRTESLDIPFPATRKVTFKSEINSEFI